MIFEKLQEMLVNQLGIDRDKVTPDADIIKDIGADSLDIVEMLMDVENEWGITVDDDAVKDLHTIGDIVKYIENNKK